MTNPNPNYHQQGGPDFTSREHELFATVMAEIKIDEELGFLCGAVELEVIYNLSIAMATHSPRGERWEYLGLQVFNLIEAQRAGEVTNQLVGKVIAARAAMPADGLPPAPYGGVLAVSDDEVHDVDPLADWSTVEGGYRWFSDGRPPEPLP